VTANWIWLVLAVLIVVEAARYAVTGRPSAFRPSPGRVMPLWARLLVLTFALVAAWSLFSRAI
jgi:hypothetical protein